MKTQKNFKKICGVVCLLKCGNLADGSKPANNIHKKQLQFFVLFYTCFLYISVQLILRLQVL